MSTRRGFGAIRRLPSKRYQAAYLGPDGVRRTAPVTFDTKEHAEGWLANRRAEILGDEWRPPTKAAPVTFGEYAGTWLERRALKPKTRHEYESLLRLRLLPTFGAVPLKAITSDLVEAWYSDQGTTTPTATARAYGLLRTLMGDATQGRKIAFNPVHIRGAGNVKRKKKIRPASLDQLATITKAMPERYRLLILLSAWCALRFGEVTELRRKDVDLAKGVLRIERAVTNVKGQYVIGPPKSDAGVRDIAIPPHLLPIIRKHMGTDITGGRDGLLFPSARQADRHLAESTITKTYYPARAKAGRSDLRLHDLRHTGAVMAAATGATIAELMARLGHSTPGAAMRYQHASEERDTEIAALLSKLAEVSATGTS